MIEYLKPRLVNPGQKIRVGPPEDGGYVTSMQCIYKADCLVSYGIGNDNRYEQEFLQRFNKDVFMFDHTIGQGHPDWNAGGLHFIAEGLGNKAGCRDFFEHFGAIQEIMWPRTKCLLKVDIEGDEYPYFGAADAKKLAETCTGILIEIHWLDQQQYRDAFMKLAANLEPYFILTHVHGNSWGSTFQHDGIELPITTELSFDNREFVEDLGWDHSIYPVAGLDYSNDPKRPDIDLKYIYENQS